MESSDESFLWTDASNDCNSDFEMAREENCDNESESGYSYKKKLHKKLFENNEEKGMEDDNIKKKCKKRKHSHIDSIDFDEPKRKHIKSEPESDLDKEQQKKVNSKKLLQCDDTLNDEDFLNYKVKEEQNLNDKKSPKINKKKKKKVREADANSQSEDFEQNANGNVSELNNTHNESYVKEEPDTESIGRKKKKNKKKKDKEYNENRPVEEENITEQIVQDDNTMDTTILEKLCKIEAKTQIPLNNNVLHEESQSFVDNDDEGEISKINSSQLNTTAKKHIKTALSQNGDINDVILSCGGKISDKISKISDRITFEDEETSEFDNYSQMNEKNYAKSSTQFQKYLKTNRHLIEVSPPIESGCVISEDDEVWVLKCPSEIDVKKLKGSNLVIDTKCKFKVESQTFVGFSESNTNNMTIVTIGGRKPIVKNIPLSGSIHLHKRIPKPHFVEDNNVINNQTNFIPLPDTKCRHPLFGVNYKNAIKVPKRVAERLHATRPELLLEDKAKAVKKKGKMETCLSDVEAEAKAEPEIRRKKKKRKRSRDGASPPEAAKRRRLHAGAPDTWDSEKAIEEHLFNF